MSRQKRVSACLLLFLAFFFTHAAVAQSTAVTGTVLDAETGAPLPGASVVVKGKIAGTITNMEGNFALTLAEPPPFELMVSFIGYQSMGVDVTRSGQHVEVQLQPDVLSLDQVVVAASKVEESIMEAPVTIEAMDIVEVRNTPSFDVYSAVSNLKGVQANTGSFTFTSINTRGFADMQNWRFVQLIDGMDASGPGLNYPVGGNSGPADIDIASIELVPGANSALYGANAFNGLLTLHTKNPFYYQGFSAYVKGGATAQDVGGSNGLFDVGLRYARSFNDKFAFKVNFGAMHATDWAAHDESYYISSSRAAQADQLLAVPRNDPNFDAVNVYGDEVQALVDLDGSGALTPINRTGIKEEDIIDYGVERYKFDTALHYRLTDNMEARYSYRFIQSDAVLRHTTIYPLVNFRQQFHLLELNGDHFTLKGYYSVEDAVDSYAMLATGGFIEQGRKSNAAWSADYGAAFRGEVADTPGNNHDAARAYADRDLPAVDSPAFQGLRAQTLSNPDITTGGSKFIEKSSLIHVDGAYRFIQIAEVLDVHVGGSFRQHKLNSEGQVFNDGPLGFNAPIPINEYGAYLQAGKRLLDERLHLRGSLRYDKNENFKGRLTPRFSTVFSLGRNRIHHLRASFQTGFRNPGSQEAYIGLNIGPAILLGGVEDNVKNYHVETADGQRLNGLDIHQGLVTLASFLAFRATGDPRVFVPANLSFLKQEKNTTYEVGYKGLIAERLLLDLHYYHTRYEDFVVRLSTFSPQAGRVYAVYTNIGDDVTSQGLGVGLEYIHESGFRGGGNYTYTSFDADDAVANTSGFLPSFNTPEHRFNLSFSNRKVAQTNLGFNIKYRWSDAYLWQSPFGQGKIDAHSIVDVALSYTLPAYQTMVKVGASNVFNQDYKTVYGGPEVGAIYYVSLTFDQMFSR